MIDIINKIKKCDIKNIYYYIYFFLLLFLCRDSLISTTILGFTKSFVLSIIISIPNFCFFIIKIKQEKNIKKSIYVLCALIASVIISVLIKQNFQLYNFSFLIIIVLAYLTVYNCSYKKFIKIYSDIMLYICAYSLITTYLLKPIIMQNNINFPITINSSGNVFYNFGFAFALNSQYYIRNYSFFREPGVFQTFISVALIFQLFYNDKECNRKINAIKVLIFIVTILTTFSTTGIIILLLTLFIYFVKLIEEKRLNKKNIGIILISILIFTTIGMFIYNLYPEFKYNIDTSVKKIFIKNDSMEARKDSIIVPLKLYFESPIIGHTFEKTINCVQNNTNTNINIFNIYGIIAGSISIVLLFLFVKKLKQKKITTILLVMVLFININTQLLIGNIILWILLFSYYMEE